MTYEPQARARELAETIGPTLCRTPCGLAKPCPCEKRLADIATALDEARGATWREARVEASRAFGDDIRKKHSCGPLTCAIGVSKYDCKCWVEGERFSAALDAKIAGLEVRK